MINKSIFFKTIIISTLFLSNLSYASPEDDGLRIAKQVKKNNTGWKSSEAIMQMHLINSDGSHSIRDMKVKTLEVANSGEKSLTIFESPSDVSGTIFFSQSMIMEPDLQWIYSKPLKQVKVILPENKSESFMGSEFSYEDMTSFQLDKFKFKLLESQILRGGESYVLELIPTDEFSGYSKQKVWVDVEKLVIQRIESYDKKGLLLKNLEIGRYEKFNNKFWRSMGFYMENIQTNKKTMLSVESISLDIGLNEKDFKK